MGRFAQIKKSDHENEILWHVIMKISDDELILIFASRLDGFSVSAKLLTKILMHTFRRKIIFGGLQVTL